MINIVYFVQYHLIPKTLHILMGILNSSYEFQLPLKKNVAAKKILLFERHGTGTKNNRPPLRVFLMSTEGSTKENA